MTKKLTLIYMTFNLTACACELTFFRHSAGIFLTFFQCLSIILEMLCQLIFFEVSLEPCTILPGDILIHWPWLHMSLRFCNLKGLCSNLVSFLHRSTGTTRYIVAERDTWLEWLLQRIWIKKDYTTVTHIFSGIHCAQLYIE